MHRSNINVQGTTTGRLSPSQPEIQRLPLTPFGASTEGTAIARGRMASQLTPSQAEWVSRASQGPVEICGDLFSKADLLAIFAGHQLPKDPAVCQALGLRSYDFSPLEHRVLSSQS